MAQGNGVTGNRQGWLDWLALDIRPRIFLLILFPLYLIILFNYPLSQFTITDKTPDLLIIDAAKQREFGAFTVKVKTGMFIKGFSTFDIINNRFVFDALIWFEFNSDEIMLESISKFSFDNGKILSKSLPDLKVLGNSTIATYDTRIEVRADLDYSKFPLEDHRLSIMMSNNSVTPYEMFFLTDNTRFQIAPDISISNWKVRDLNTDSGYLSPQLDTQNPEKNASFPKAMFILNLQKSGVRKVLVIFIPIFLAMMLAFFSFMMSYVNTVGRLTLASSGVSAQLGYRFVLERMLPEVSYFTTTDKLYLLLLLVSFLVFVAQLFIGRYFNLKKSGQKGGSDKIDLNYIARLNSSIFYSLIILVMAMSAYFILT